MKNNILALSLFAAFGANATAPLLDDVYFGAGVKASKLKLRDSGNSLDLGNASGYSLEVGKNFDFNELFTLAVEVQYNDFGSFDKTQKIGYMTADSKFDTSSFGINFIPKVYLTQNFFLGGKAGLHRMKGKGDIHATDGYDVVTDNGSGNGTAPVLGVMVGYNFNRITLTAGYDAYYPKINDDKFTLETVNMNVSYSF